MRTSPLSMVALAAIRLYQRTTSGGIGPVCRYEPSCSHYAIGALKTHGALRGTALSLIHNFAGVYSGSSWAFSGLTSGDDLFLNPNPFEVLCGFARPVHRLELVLPFFQLDQRLPGFGLLLRRMEKNGRAILGSDIISLRVERGGIVCSEEHRQQVAE